MIPICEIINRFPRVCTLQSCAGHKAGERSKAGSGGEAPLMANLWLWFDEVAALRFRDAAMEFAENEYIEYVHTLYQPYGQEILDISFQGNNFRPSRLGPAIAVVYDMVERVACQ